MSDDGSKLLESLMGSLGDNPAETIGQMLSALSKNQETPEDVKNEPEETAFSCAHATIPLEAST